MFFFFWDFELVLFLANLELIRLIVAPSLDVLDPSRELFILSNSFFLLGF
jgi:hypothetical protein